MASCSVPITGAVEGAADEAVLARLVTSSGAEIGVVYGKKGKDYLRRNIVGYNNAARFYPWVVLADLNSEEQCAPLLRESWLQKPAPLMCFRVAVRELEAWLIADPERFSSFFKVPRRMIPSNCEAVANPKEALVDLARSSRSRRIREEMVPRPGSRRPVGPAYTSRLIEFVTDPRRGWRPDIASTQSESLRGTIDCIRWLIGKYARQIGAIG